MKKLLVLIGGIFLSTLGYSQWTAQNSGTNENLTKIWFLDSMNGYSVGAEGTFLVTQNGGHSWTSNNIPDTEELQDVYFTNPQNGFIHSANHVYHTTNGGSSFSDITNMLANPDDTAYTPLAITMAFKGNSGVVAAFYFNNSTPNRSVAIHTIDGGLTWNTIMPPTSWRGFYSIVNDSVIYAALLSTEYRSNNGGGSWDTVRNLNFSVLSEQHFRVFDVSGKGYASVGYEYGFEKLYNDDSSRTTSALEPNSICFVNQNIGYACQNNLYKTSDGGEHLDSIGVIPPLVNTIFFLDEDTGFTCGADGKIYKTMTGGGVTNINEMPNLKKEIEVYPNPAQDNIRLKYSQTHIQTLQLLDITGKSVKTYPSESKALDVSGVAAGLYFLHIKTKEADIKEKIVIIR